MRFQQYIDSAHRQGKLVVQPRMGFGLPAQMRRGLQAVRNANATTVGTITLDSFTRLSDWASVAQALADGRELNGFPIFNLGVDCTRAMLKGLQSEDFPIQVRHGSSRPEAIFAAVRDCEIDATEGGPVSYCLPYSRTPLSEAITSWHVQPASCWDMRTRAARPRL